MDRVVSPARYLSGSEESRPPFEAVPNQMAQMHRGAIYATKLGLPTGPGSPFFPSPYGPSPGGDHPPPAHLGLPPYHPLDPKSSLVRTRITCNEVVSVPTGSVLHRRTLTTGFFDSPR
ncbi:unnamed protein product [Cyprideis torosa]|uniref:Uncharacterized protein n=1 Tax=Cyprideis torosa TaxID=163714 RepID=A0A7R8W5Z2_9CRUS|nr:unnamed protein product [Cyprideis torosa]CAG0880422.1 unnamed protein product [Cyprideis torosa]